MMHLPRPSKSPKTNLLTNSVIGQEIYSHTMNIAMNSNTQPQLKIVNEGEGALVNRKRGFLEWMSYIKNANQGNLPAMNRALNRLAIYDSEK